MFSDKIIILKTVKYGEADLIIHGLNQWGGKQIYIAKSALRSRKRFGGGILEPIHFVEMLYSKKALDEKMQLVNEARLLKDFSKLRTDYDRLQLAFYFLKVIDKMTLEGSVDGKDIFNLLGHSLKQAETSEDLMSLRLLFEAKLLHSQGVLPPEAEYLNLLRVPVAKHQQLNLSSHKQDMLFRKIDGMVKNYLSR